MLNRKNYPYRMFPVGINDEYDPADIVNITSQEGYVILQSKEGRIYGKGENYRSQLGFPSVNRNIANLSHLKFDIPIISCESGFNFTLFLGQNGIIYGTGLVDFNQFSIDSVANEQVMLKRQVNVEGLLQVLTGCKKCVQFSCGNNHSYFLENNRRQIFTSGSNKYGETGISPIKENQLIELPMEVFNLDYLTNDQSEIITDMKCGLKHNLILTNKNVYFSGNNEFNQLDKDLFDSRGNITISGMKLDLTKIEELTGSRIVSKIYNGYDQSGLIMDNKVCIIFGGKYLDKTYKEFQVLKHPNGIF